MIVDPANPDAKARYVVSASGGHAAHPSEILASCQALEDHLKKMRIDAEKTIKDWEGSVRQRELAEKRRVAPGWLDREEKLLQPVQARSSRKGPDLAHQPSILDSQSAEQSEQAPPAMVPRDEGEELDRAFGGLGVK